MCLLIHRSAQKQNELCVQFALLLTSHVASCPTKTKPRAKNILLYHFLNRSQMALIPIFAELPPDNSTCCYHVQKGKIVFKFLHLNDSTQRWKINYKLKKYDTQYNARCLSIHWWSIWYPKQEMHDDFNISQAKTAHIKC